MLQLQCSLNKFNNNIRIVFFHKVYFQLIPNLSHNSHFILNNSNNSKFSFYSNKRFSSSSSSNNNSYNSKCYCNNSRNKSNYSLVPQPLLCVKILTI